MVQQDKKFGETLDHSYAYNQTHKLVPAGTHSGKSGVLEFLKFVLPPSTAYMS